MTDEELSRLAAEAFAEVVQRLNGDVAQILAENNKVRSTLFSLLEAAKTERDMAGYAPMDEDPFLYGQRMWYGGRVTGIVEASLIVIEGTR